MHKLTKTRLPEFYLLSSVLIYWASTTFLNPFAIGLFLIIASLIGFRNRVLGIAVGAVFLLLNCYMVLALLSEFYEFEKLNWQAMQLILVGGLYLGLNIFMGILLLLKWAPLPLSKPGLSGASTADQ